MAGENEDAVLVVGLSEHGQVLGSLPKTGNLHVLLPSRHVVHNAITQRT